MAPPPAENAALSASDRSTEPDLARLRAGLRMAHPPDPDALAREKAHLAALERKNPGERAWAYIKLGGPGYLQSAMTLGSGTAATSLLAGAAFGYDLLWVAPVAMLFGVIMLSAIAHQTLSTGMRPFEAMRRFAGAPLAWAWAFGALIASVIWHFPQYSLAAAGLVDLGEVAGAGRLAPGAMGLVVLVVAVSMSMLYGASATAVRWYERLLKYMVWGIVLCFGAVVVSKLDRIDWGAVLRGYTTFRIPGRHQDVAAVELVISGLAAAVGINMVFLYPYTLLARGWGREHRRLARFDLGLGMLLPYALATSLMVIGMAATVHEQGFEVTRGFRPVDAARALEGIAGASWSRVVLDLGVIGMALSSITLHMLCTGFVCTELFDWKVGSLRYRLATLLPVPGVLGPFLWSEIAVWLAVPTNIVCGIFLPAAYVGFILLQRSRAYLGRDRPAGAGGTTWLGAMIVATGIVVVFLTYYVIERGPAYFKLLFSG